MSLYEKTNLLITANAVKAGKLYSVIPSSGSGDCVVVRNTTATRINSLGLIVDVVANVPRLNYALNTGGEGFILDEPQRSNLITFSNTFTDSSWIKQGTVTITPNTTISPRGTLTASTLKNATGANVNQSVFQRNIISTNATASSIFVKTLGVATTVTIFNRLSNGSVVSSVFSLTSGNWIRVSLLSSNSPNALNQFFIGGTDGDVAIFGGQIEQGTSLTSYIDCPSSSAVTRNADVITVAPPAGTVKITTTFSNNTTQVITSIPSTYTMPEGLIKQVLMQNSL